MAFAANVSKPKTISKTRAGSNRTVELKGHLPKAMNIGDGTAKKYELIGRVVWPKGWWWRPEEKNRRGSLVAEAPTKPPSGLAAQGLGKREGPEGTPKRRQQNRPRVWSPAEGGWPSVGGGQ